MDIAGPPALNTVVPIIFLSWHTLVCLFVNATSFNKKDFCLTKFQITILLQMVMWQSKSIIAIIYWCWVSWPALSHWLTIITLVCPIKCNPSIKLADVANICFVQREITLFWNLHRGYSLSTVFYNHWVVRRVWYRSLIRYINPFHL
jgi:hypothetical protein